MASCSPATLQAQACANGFLALSGTDQKAALAVVLQLWSNLSGNTLTLDQLKAQACANGFLTLSGMEPKAALAVELQELCNLIGGETACVNLIPEGATYDGAAYVVNTVIAGHTYQITFGTNDLNFFNTNGTPEVVLPLPSPGDTVEFIASEFTAFQLIAVVENGPVTATICEI